MAVKVRVQSIERDVQLAIDETLSPAARSKMFAESAAEFLKEADETNRQALGRVPKNTTFVDGRRGAALTSVRPDGVIVRDYELIQDVLVFIRAELQRNSAVGRGPDKRPGHPGFFRASHALFADGSEVPIGTPIPDAREFVFLSTVPYARRIEMHHTLYEKTAAVAHRRFGNIARVSFGWRAPIASRSSKIERATRVPAIIVTIGR